MSYKSEVRKNNIVWNFLCPAHASSAGPHPHLGPFACSFNFPGEVNLSAHILVAFWLMEQIYLFIICAPTVSISNFCHLSRSTFTFQIFCLFKPAGTYLCPPRKALLVIVCPLKCVWLLLISHCTCLYVLSLDEDHWRRRKATSILSPWGNPV